MMPLPRIFSTSTYAGLWAWFTWTAAIVLAQEPGASQAPVPTRQVESLGRGLVGVYQDDGQVFLSWRSLRDDPPGLGFNVYLSTDGGPPEKRNAQPLVGPTGYLDRTADSSKLLHYSIKTVHGEVEEGSPPALGHSYMVRPETRETPYLLIPLRTLPGHTPNDASVGDLDGDGEYEVVLKQEMNPRDNSQGGLTGETKLEAYKLDGTFLWRINLGKNIREGAHYTPFLVFDFDGDGKAEVACKTADGTIDGAGVSIGDPKADHRNPNGFILEGPEFLTVFEGQTGRALATTSYIPARGQVSDWGDRSGNRVDRFLAAVAYLDGQRPSLVMCRGYYTRTVLTAWNWRGGTLSRVWTFDSDDPAQPDLRRYRGQGNHNLAVGDLDGDGRDEIVYGACAIDDDGRGLYSTGLGHGDALHLSDIDPDRPGLEVFDIHERAAHPHGAELHDARTGTLIWSKLSRDVGRGVSMDIDPRHRGYEQWASGPGLRGLWSAKGEMLSGRKPRSCNFGVWWDGDRLREILNGTTITKWNWADGTETSLLSAADCRPNNSTKATPCLCADILGDWREEVILRSSDNRSLRIYTTTIPTEHRLVTLMHDPQYRLSVAWQNVGYNQPTQPGFYLGHDMRPPAQRPVRPD